MKLLRKAISYGVFPIVFGGAMWSALVAAGRGSHPGIVLAVITVVTALIVAICERLNPEHPRWNRPQNDVRTDAAHGVVSFILVPKLLETLLSAALLSATIATSPAKSLTLWPHNWPIGGQLVLAMLISQFGEYWMHRLMHTSPLLWRLHATHHSPGRLYFLNAARFHPLDSAILFCAGLGPLWALGAPSQVLLLVSVWVSVHGLFQHCNIRVRLGPLNYIFSMAELHRWHHSLKLNEANRNYGNNIILWDLIFGTLYYPKDRQPSEFIGLSDIENFPEDYLGQLLSPLRWQSLQASKPNKSSYIEVGKQS